MLQNRNIYQSLVKSKTLTSQDHEVMIGKKLISTKMAKMTSYINAMFSFLIHRTDLKHLFLESHQHILSYDTALFIQCFADLSREGGSKVSEHPVFQNFLLFSPFPSTKLFIFHLYAKSTEIFIKFILSTFQIPQCTSPSLSSSLRRSSCHEFFLDREYHEELVPATQRILDREKDRMNQDLIAANRKVHCFENLEKL